MNAFYRLVAGVANALEALWRLITRLHEQRPDPYHISRYSAWSQSPAPELTVAFEPAHPRTLLAAKQQDEVVALAWTFRPSVSLRKEQAASAVPAPSLIRPFIGPLKAANMNEWRGRKPTVDLGKRVVAARAAVGRAAVAVRRNVDALGMPLNERLSDDSTPTLGIFEQTAQAWKLRTGNRNDLSWA